MGIIADKVKKGFDEFKESLENQTEQKESIRGLVTALVEIADRSVQYEHHRQILDREIEGQFAELDNEGLR